MVVYASIHDHLPRRTADANVVGAAKSVLMGQEDPVEWNSIQTHLEVPSQQASHEVKR